MSVGGVERRTRESKERADLSSLMGVYDVYSRWVGLPVMTQK